MFSISLFLLLLSCQVLSMLCSGKSIANKDIESILYIERYNPSSSCLYSMATKQKVI